jgi:hypothetical protein
MKNHNLDRTFFLALVLGALSGAALAMPTSGASTAAGGQAFDTPQQAADAIVQASAAGDVATLEKILGPGGKDIVVSGDPVEDKNNLEKFAAKAHEKMSVSVDAKNSKRATLLAGNDDWPMPIPIVQNNGKWRFDVAQGKHEILARRIGGNELDTIDILRGFVDAQKEYASELRNGAKTHQYAQKWISTPGKQDGLSWNGPDGKPAGPIGDEIAKLLAEGYSNKAEPINGYYFRTLTAQGPNARLGARNYIVDGAMIGGFAAVAWPAKYGSTGIQTFLVNNDGDVYQKNLGPDTAKIVAGMKTYNPDKTWTITEDEED